MAQAEVEQAPQDSPERLEGGAYEIIRNRLRSHGQQLRAALERLNVNRKEVFGSIETELLRTERITTEHNCVPRDMVAIGDQFLFGYNVQFGLKTETQLSDVFSVYRFRDEQFHSESLDVLGDAQFQRDYHELYRYYKNARFAKFFHKGTSLHMVFAVGKSISDIKSLKWVLTPEGPRYAGNRSDHEVRYPPQHEFEWTRTHRELHRGGLHPHISIADRVFVETVGGDLTIKIENNTESGEGIYAEDVEHKDQTLDDAEVFYAIVGNIILLKIRPYQEPDFRYIIYNEKVQQACRLDAVANACVLLPDDHGLIFSNGYYLQTGESKTFDTNLVDMLFDRRIAAPNGEDYLYIFYNRASGMYVLLRYNLIEQKVETPVVCHGFTLFNDGRMLCFRGHEQPQKHHAVQLWQTPYVGEDYVPHAETDSFLYKIGNRDIVRGMAECHEVLNLLNKDESFANLYSDIVKASADILDSYFWINNPEAGNLAEPLAGIRDAAAAAVDEFDKVLRARRNTSQQTEQAARQATSILKAVDRRRFEHINDFVASLSDLRHVRGDIIALRDLKYVDAERVDALEQEVVEAADRTAHRCVQFLLQPGALQPYAEAVQNQQSQIEELATVAAGKKLEEEIDKTAGELEMLIEIVSNLKIDDATHRTQIIDNISGNFTHINQARAKLRNHVKQLMSAEGVAEFHSQLRLLNQSVVNYLDISDSPEKCDEFLTKVMVQIEELEGRFAEFDEFVLELTEKREEIYNAFESRKLSLVEARNRRAASLMSAADRILKGIQTRVGNLEEINDIHGYFASDLMIEKVRDIVGELQELGDTVKVDDIQSRLKSTREDAVRQLKDQKELFVDGKNVIQFGNHQFNVNQQPLDLTTVLHEEEICLHLTGTNYFYPIEDQRFQLLSDVWKQEVVSENASVYRGEFLAFQLWRKLGSDGLPQAGEFFKLSPEERMAVVQRFAAPRYTEGYVKGVNDADATTILGGLIELQSTLGPLRYAPQARALAELWWEFFAAADRRKLWAGRIHGYGQVEAAFPGLLDRGIYLEDLQQSLVDFANGSEWFDAQWSAEAAEFLFDTIADEQPFPRSRQAVTLWENFQQQVRSSENKDAFEKSLRSVGKDSVSRVGLARHWAEAFVRSQGDEADLLDFIDELSLLMLRGDAAGPVVDGRYRQELSGLSGDHKVVHQGKYELHYNHFMQKLRRFCDVQVPRFEEYQQLKKFLVEQARDDMRLEEFRPRVLTSFVRNRLIDTVYLPLVGDNLAKQMGTAGEQKRTDRMGLLLLISPPGYGKTTLMEYIANRLGLVFMKINGPAIGHQVTSLDPKEAANAAAREELEKLNLSLEMGDNIMLYVDDIQHCNPEFLQKFISLRDAQRKIEGVYRGKTRTYDLRGRKVAVVMAGNPYTESGEKFQIPDMLSNRADIYNLGEIIGDSEEAFELSYLENSLTSNPVLNRLASRSQKDVYAIIKIAETGSQEGIDLEGSYSVDELDELSSTMQKLLTVRDIVLKVNREYIRSAAQADEYRTEPPFKLQGSYRNMNRIAERVLPIMNDDELQTLIVSSYENDAQTLTSETESNLLKFKELMGILDDTQAQRWEAIKRAYRQNVKMKGLGSDDQAAHVIAQLSGFNEQLELLRDTLGNSAKQWQAQSEQQQAQSEQQQAQVEAEEHRRAETISQEVAALRASIAAVGDVLQERLQPPAAEEPAAPGDGTKAVADALAAAGDPASPLHRVTVQHKVPRSILEVVRRQFELMQQWLAPLAEQTRSQTGELAELRKAVDSCMASYDHLLKDLEEARGKKQP